METIYSDIAARTGGNVYIGVVGPVRTGKSTLIKHIMQTLVIPQISDPYQAQRAKDELPQSGSGKIQGGGHRGAAGGTAGSHVLTVGIFGLAHRLTAAAAGILGFRAHVCLGDDHSALLQEVGNHIRIILCDLAAVFLKAVGGVVACHIHVVLHHHGNAEK